MFFSCDTKPVVSAIKKAAGDGAKEGAKPAGEENGGGVVGKPRNVASKISPLAQAEWDKICHSSNLERQPLIETLMRINFCKSPNNKKQWYKEVWPHVVRDKITYEIDWWFHSDRNQKGGEFRKLNGGKKEDEAIAGWGANKKQHRKQLANYACDSVHALNLAKTEAKSKMTVHFANLKKQYIDKKSWYSLDKDHELAKSTLSRARVERELDLNNLCPGL